jgi:non-ribosomal peptide synthetase component F
LPIQYADFAVWQRRWLTGERLEGLLAWWRGQLAGLPPLLEMPGDRPRPAVQSFRGASLPVVLSAPLARSLRDLARRGEATLFMALLAGFQAFLHRATGQDDLAVGTPIANRGRRELEGLIGCFINSLVLRGDLSGRPTGRELLARTRSAALGAYAHQDLPFELLVERLQPERSLSHGPLFQVMFLLQNTPESGLDLPELATEALPLPEGVAKLDLLLALSEAADGTIHGSLDTSRDLFDPPTAARLLAHLVALLDGMAADPDRRIDELPLLSAAERHQLLKDWNDTATDYGADRPGLH